MPTRAKKTTTTPTRRSTRIASREASQEPAVEPAAPAPPPPPAAAPAPAKKEAAAMSIEAIAFTIREQIGKKRGANAAQKFINALTREQCEAALFSLAKQANNLESENENLTDENGNLEYELSTLKQATKSSIRRDAFIKKIESYGQDEKSSISEPAREENHPSAPSTAISAASLPTAGPVVPVQSPPQQSGQKSLSAAPAAPAQPAAAEIEPVRPAAPSPWREILSNLTGYIPGLRKRKATDEAGTPDATPKRARVIEQEITPISRPSPRSGLMRSVKNPEVPSSLSTITEYSEPSTIMEDTTPMVPNTTPSRPRHTMSANPMSAHPISTYTTSTHTSSAHTAPSQTAATKATSVTPTTHTASRQTAATLATSVTPARRTVEQNRMSRKDYRLGTPPPRPYAWEKNAAKPKPKEPNADARLAKLQQLQDLEAKAKQAQKEADELKAEMALMKQDADIREIEAHSVHRRKRVKVDHLKVIPHKRPGDSSSTFRVPDINSDDEMSVDEDVEEESNIFDELEQRYQQAQEQTPVQPAVQTPMFVFPDVAKKPDNYHASEEFKEAAGDLFSQGFQQYISA